MILIDHEHTTSNNPNGFYTKNIPIKYAHGFVFPCCTLYSSSVVGRVKRYMHTHILNWNSNNHNEVNKGSLFSSVFFIRIQRRWNMCFPLTSVLTKLLQTFTHKHLRCVAVSCTKMITFGWQVFFLITTRQSLRQIWVAGKILSEMCPYWIWVNMTSAKSTNHVHTFHGMYSYCT